MATFKSNTYGGRYLLLTITETVDAQGNRSNLAWTLESTGGESNYYTIEATTVTINGTVVYQKGKTYWNQKVFPAAKGSVNGTLAVDHEPDGTKTIEVGFSTGVYNGVLYQCGGTMKLADIDRTAATVSLSVSNITTNSIKISATASTKCDLWHYSVDNGSTWTQFSTTDATSAAVTVTGLAANTSYKVKVKARRTYNHVTGTSSAVTAKTLGHAIIESCDDFYIDAEDAYMYPKITVYESSFTEYFVFKRGDVVIARTDVFKLSSGTETRAIKISERVQNLILDEMSTAERKYTIVVETYDGNTLIGTSECPVTIKTSTEGSGPSWEYPYLAWEDTSPCVAVTGRSDIMIQGHSNLVVTAIGVTANNYASISDYTVTIGEKTVRSSSPVVNVGTVDKDGDLTMRLTVTDSRGHSVYVTRTVTVLKYAPPKITKCTVRRANGIDDVIQLAFTASMSTITPDGEDDVNSLVDASYRYKLTSAGDDLEDYSEPVPITEDVIRSSTGTTLSFESKQLLSLDNDYSYNFRLVVEDRVASSVTYYVIPKGIPVMAVRKDKLGINNPDPQYSLDVAGDIGLTGGLYRNGKNVIGDTGWIDLGISDKVSVTENEDAGHYNGCAYRVVGDNHVYVAFNVSASITGTAIKVSGTAIPSKYRPVMQPFGFAPLNGSRIARTYVNRGDGHVYLDWVHNIADATEPAEHVVTWIDGYIDYWI